MPTRRMIDPCIWQSESMAKLTVQQRLLFIGLFSNADDQGRLRANPALIRSLVFPYDDVPVETVRQDLQAINATGSTLTYEVDGIEYIQITGWWKYQSPQWAYPSKFPAPEGWQDQLRYRHNNQVITQNWPTSLPKALPKTDGQDDSQGHSVKVNDSDSDRGSTSFGASAPPEDTPPDPKQELRFDSTPEGAVMAQKLRSVYESKKRRPPEHYANAAQRQAYLTAFRALGSKIASLLDTAMERDITDRARLLTWLQGCMKKNGNGTGPPGSGRTMSKAEQAIALSRQISGSAGR